MVLTGKDLKGYLIPAVLPRTGMSFSRSGCSGPHLPGLECCQRWASTASLHNLLQCFIILRVVNFSLICTLNLPSFNLKTLPLCLSSFGVLRPLCTDIIYKLLLSFIFWPCCLEFSFLLNAQIWNLWRCMFRLQRGGQSCEDSAGFHTNGVVCSEPPLISLYSSSLQLVSSNVSWRGR